MALTFLLCSAFQSRIPSYPQDAIDMSSQVKILARNLPTSQVSPSYHFFSRLFFPKGKFLQYTLKRWTDIVLIFISFFVVVVFKPYLENLAFLFSPETFSIYLFTQHTFIMLHYCDLLSQQAFVVLPPPGRSHRSPWEYRKESHNPTSGCLYSRERNRIVIW